MRHGFAACHRATHPCRNLPAWLLFDLAGGQTRWPICDQAGKKTAETAAARALAAKGRTAHVADGTGTLLPRAPGIETEAMSGRHWQMTFQVTQSFNTAVRLTFDVRGGPLAGRPLDGGVRRTGLSKEMTGTRGRQQSDWAVRSRRG
jgi:hypothetical protein